MKKVFITSGPVSSLGAHAIKYISYISAQIHYVITHFGRDMRKRVFGHMRTAGPSLYANKIIGYYRMFQ